MLDRVPSALRLFLSRFDRTRWHHWCVYCLVNRSRNEILYRVAPEPCDPLQAGAAQSPPEISHWSFEADDIRGKVIQTALTRKRALAMARVYAETTPDNRPGFKIITP